MSHIAYELDAFPLVPKVARAAGVAEAIVGWGLPQMWEWCWREKTDKVTTNHLRGFFGVELGPVLVDFGFLERVGADRWRVRGAARYLRISQAQSDGGKKARANLKQYRNQPVASSGSPTGSPPAPHRLEPEDTRSEDTGSLSDERLATSDERQANIFAGTPPPPKPKPTKPERPPPPAPDPRHAPLVAELAAIFERKRGAKYPWDGRDAKAIASLLAKAIPPTIAAAFDRALDSTHPTTSSFWELDLRFAKYVAAEPTTKKPNWLEERNREQAEEHVEGRVRL